MLYARARRPGKFIAKNTSTFPWLFVVKSVRVPPCPVPGPRPAPSRTTTYVTRLVVWSSRCVVVVLENRFAQPDFNFNFEHSVTVGMRRAM